MDPRPDELTVDGAERHAEFGGDVSLGQVGPVREVDDGPLGHAEFGDRPLHIDVGMIARRVSGASALSSRAARRRWARRRPAAPL